MIHIRKIYLTALISALMITLNGCYMKFTSTSSNTAMITADELHVHIAYLASDSLEGRKPGKIGGKKAAEYIVRDLSANGVTLMGENGYQYFEVVTGATFEEGNQLLFNQQSLKLEEDYTPLAFTSNDTLTAEVTFCGYGFDFKTDSLEWNDYSNMDVSGKWTMILRGEPKEDDVYMSYSSLQKKVLVAKDHGAAGVMFVSGEEFDAKDELIPLLHSPGQTDAGIPVLHIKRTVADKILSKIDETVKNLEQGLITNLKPQSKELEQSATVITSVSKKKVTTSNVVGFVEGSDPVLKDEFVVIGAHYDHLGFGGPHSGSREVDTLIIHNGADDNASGTAGILEIIEKVSLSKNPPKRSVLFIAFGAEEMGVIGSKYFIKNPLIDLDKVNVMMNLDMIGRFNNETESLSIGGTGTALEFKDELERLAEKHGLDVALSPGGIGPSDHSSFYLEDIPVLFFFTGIHNDYHTSRDDIEFINFEGQKRVADYIYDLVEIYANEDSRLTYQESGPKVNPSGRKRFKVTLGIMPDVTSSESDGLRIDGVIPDRPAYIAGLKKGDVIIAMDGKSVNGIYEYMHRLSDFNPGQRITVTVRRGDENVMVIVEL